jgi:beta-glucanase (GH16 family)
VHNILEEVRVKNRTIAATLGTLISAVFFAWLATPAHATWSLVWWDEFNGTSLNTSDWNYDFGTGCPSLCGWGNNELQYYRAENVAVSGGNLVITSLAESFGGASFTSGKVHTRNKQSFLYGRVEMRAKIPTGDGMWPAFWMMPQDNVYGGWAASGEIDIMESANSTTSVGGTIHYGGSWPNNVSTSGSYSLGGANFADEFHIYAIEWEPDAIRWYVDGVLYSTKTSSQWYTNAAPGNPQAPFDQAFYIILNTAVGGNYTGCTDPGCITASLPQQYLIDYVRVYHDIVNTPPAVSITSPGSGAVLPAGNITINATASDADGSVATVEFYNGFTYLGEDTTAPYTFVWTSVTDGCYEIVARVIDDLGGVETDAVDIAVGTGCGQAPYSGTPFVFPAKIEAEDFDDGGEGVAYHDTDPGNNGSQYRTSEGVDIEACTDAGGGYNVGWVVQNEWLEYTVSVPSAGDYSIDVRVASLSAGGTFHLAFNGTDKTGDITVPVTGGWQTWATVSATATLEAGVQTMRFVTTADGFNVNYVDVVMLPTAITSGGHPAHSELHPCYPNPFNPVTTISFDLRERVPVTLSIYDVTGRRVKTLMDAEAVDAGRHEQVWDGRDESGKIVATGVYFYRLDAGGYSKTRKMVMTK